MLLDADEGMCMPQSIRDTLKKYSERAEAEAVAVGKRLEYIVIDLSS